MHSLRGRARAAALALCLVLLASCRADTRVSVVVHDDGSGSVAVVVALDPEAATAIGEIDDALAVDDLRAAGWSVTTSTEDDGSATVRLSKPFTSVEEANQILADLGGPVHSVVLGVEDSLVRDRWSVTGRLDYRDGLDVFSDHGLAQVLGSSLDGIVLRAPVELELRMPGARTQRWAAESGEQVVISAASTRWHVETLVLATAGFVLAFLALGVLLVGGRRARRR